MNFFGYSRPEKGVLISVEGNSGTGKTTLVKELADRFSDLVIISEISDQIDEIPYDLLTILNKLNKNSDIFFLNAPPVTSLFLLSAIHFHLIESRVIPALNEGKVVVCDRFLDSPALLQCIILGMEKNMTDEDIYGQYCGIMELYSKMAFLPDYTFVLKEDFSTCLKRIESRENAVTSEKERMFLEKTNLLWSMVKRNNLAVLNQDLARKEIIKLIESNLV